ncbi:hypothetical protein V495_01391 [Pseudogymnoascus sp. VKM F-4514 (FW-929)]|nr:hypothetical protein V495_01391 [Pseudogymnoascus sp. VKM F-4514 (FW-929)]KFY54258.1 hypothetical protein V497_07852 [Pseudogymnoascus sp. VKM F-4516 (FW-969)]
MTLLYGIVGCAVLLGKTVSAQGGAWAQCGGQGWTGPTSCISGYACTYSNDWYSQCIPGTNTQVNPTPTPTPTNNPGGGGGGKTKYAGVNMAGFDFGMATTGTQDASQILTPPNAQMSHFVNDDKMNIFRLPVGWQFLVDSPGAQLNSGNLARYDSLVQACLNTGAACIIDIHNYARWNGAIVGQGGPSNDQLANTWSQLASKYASKSQIIFGVMNEPHDIPSITTWATTVQACVNAIRKAGATSQMILLPGNGWTGAATFVSDGSLAALKNVKNLDGSTTNLIFDVHKYLDSDGSGTHTDCVTGNVDVFNNLASALRSAGRQAMVSETGGGNTQSCINYVCQEIATLNANSDVYLGYVAWAAGAWQPSWNYELNLVPTQNGNSWTDTSLVNACLKRS